MAYVVYHKKSTVLVKSFTLESSAKRSTTCMNRNSGAEEYACAEENVYRNDVVHNKTVKNLLSGQDVTIPSNTPHCCDPSTETYWSM